MLFSQSIPEIFLVKVRRFEVYRQAPYDQNGPSGPILQDNQPLPHARSLLRWLHVQIVPSGQAKLSNIRDTLASVYRQKMADRALDRCLAWNAPSIAIDWPLQGNAPIQSEKVAAQPNLSDLPDYFQYSRS